MTAQPKTMETVFPSGLFQPGGSFRFSLDALLLASFTLRYSLAGKGSAHIMDLGCGCGVIGLACLLECGRATVTGVDREAELVAAARENAFRLGVADRFSAFCRDLTDEKARVLLEEKRADAVLANMPYRAEGTGRLPQSPMRRRALFADASTMPGFMLAAKAALKPGGVFDLIYPWTGRDTLFAALESHGFFPERILPVCTVEGKTTLCLVSSGREPVAAKLLPPLSLRRKRGGEYTAEARFFCPWL